MPEICQRVLPIKPWMSRATKRLPGIQPVAEGEWLERDDAYAAQMAYRDSLIFDRRDEVFREVPESRPAQMELLETVLAELGAGYVLQGEAIIRPDGVSVRLKDEPPLILAAKLVQEDLLLLDMTAEPTLNAAVLCFPASWTLDEKFGGGLMGIHDYVDEYSDDMAKRVERLFIALRPEQPLWRANFLRYEDAELHQPRRVGEDKPAPEAGGFVRVERQTLRKLPKTGAVVFGIHTYVVPWGLLTPDEQAEFQRETA